MWKQIRGLGLAYHYRMYCRPEEGLLYFQLFKCTHVVNAYKQAIEIVVSVTSINLYSVVISLKITKFEMFFFCFFFHNLNQIHFLHALHLFGTPCLVHVSLHPTI